MAIQFLRYSEHPEFLEPLREIFFLSSTRKEFGDETEKADFFDRWTGYYLREEPARTWLAVGTGSRLFGYLTGCADSLSALPVLRERIPSYPVFADQFVAYPAHFHINCHPETRGQGIGSLLLARFVNELHGRGVHLITSPDAANVSFYRRNGFRFEQERDWRGQRLLFMGRALTSA